MTKAIVGLSELRPGQRVKVKGTESQGTFVALEVELRPTKDVAKLEALVEDVDRERREIVVLGCRIAVPPDAEIQEEDGTPASFDAVAARALVKLSGQYSANGGFRLESIRLKEPLAFNILKIQGTIERVDSDQGLLELLGFAVTLTPRTVIEGV